MDKREEKYNRIMDTLYGHWRTVREHYPDNTIVFLGLYGSQNYELDLPTSDIDSKCIILPTERDLILGKKMISVDLQCPDGGLCNVKDIRLMFENFYKGNINFVEILYSKYQIINDSFSKEMHQLIDNRDLIARRDPVKLIHMAAGMATQKFIAFDKPFESKKEILAKYGYDPKQLSHLVRLYYFIRRYYLYKNFEKALIPNKEERNIIRDIKIGIFDYDSAKYRNGLVADFIDKMVLEIDKNKKFAALHTEEGDAKVKELFEEIIYSCIHKILH